ncbi:MAG: GTP pyrophosphokinase [Thiohalocapsa sp.]
MKHSSPAETDFLDQALPKHARLTRVVQTLIANILNDEGVDFLSVTGRTKTRESASEKITRKSYANPSEQLTDLTGIRIVTYLDHQVGQISNIISDTFIVDTENSMDRAQILGNDKVGYRSVHFVCSLGHIRKGMREYKDLCSLKFEIQIRTVLQHAWAELTHDRSYKFSGVLPEALQRKLNLYAGILEVVDTAFDQIALSVDSYTEGLRSDQGTELADASINTISLVEFLTKLKNETGIKVHSIQGDPDLIREMDEFGLNKISDLQALITPEILKFYKDAPTETSEFGFLRTAMMFNDIEKYLNMQPTWKTLPLRHLDALIPKYGEEDIKSLLSKYGKHLGPA